MTGVSNAQLASAVNAIVSAANARDGQLAAWQAGTATGGPNGDGRYPLTSYTGTTILVASPARLEALVATLVNGADGAKAETESLRDEVLQALATVELRTTQAGGHASAAATSKTQADTFRQQAASSEANALVHRNAAAASAAGAASSATLAEERADAADAAATAAASSATAASTSANNAAASAALAATFNPTEYYKTPQVDTLLTAKLSVADFAWGTLPGKPTTFAPSAHSHNIADVTGLQAALDGKQAAGSYAAASHAHAIADVTGLQSALDGKQPVGSYLTAITSAMVAAALGYTPYNSSNPAGYITGITNGNVTTALGYTPANRAGDTFTGSVVTAGNLDTSGGDVRISRTNNAWGYITRPNTAGFKNLQFAVDGGGALDNVYANTAALRSSGDVRGAIFYDEYDTNFYVDPNGSTRLTRLSFTGQFENPGSMNADWDGGYYHFSPTQNTPDGNWGHSHIIRLNGDWNVQQFWPTGNPNMMWFRKRLSGSYGAWQSVMTGTANQWNQSSDGRNRLYFASNDSTIFGTGGGYQWRNSSDSTILSLGSDGGLIATGLVVGRNGVGSNVNSMNDTGSFSVRGDVNNAAAISFHRTGAYAVNMGLGTDAVFRVGGWSMQANCLQIYGSGVVQALNDFRAPIFYDSDNTAFYANPAGTSVMNTLALGGQGSAPQGAIWSGGNIWMVGDGRKLAFSTDGSPDDGGNVSIFAWGNDFRINNWSGSSLNDNFWVFGASRDAACAGNFTAYYSDERLKTRTGPLANALHRVASLEGFTYVENEVARSVGYANSKPQVGLSAQQVQAVLPEAVSLAPFDYDVKEDGTIVSKSGENYLTVDYSRLVPLLIEAIKELKAEVDDLKAQGN